MKSIDFTFKNTDGESFKYQVPSASFLFSDTDMRTNLTTCHLGIVAQKHENMDYWTLGGVFMENFYVTYDAEDRENLLVGLSYTPIPLAGSTAPVDDPKGTSSKASYVIALITAAGLIVIFSIIGICLCVRSNR